MLFLSELCIVTAVKRIERKSKIGKNNTRWRKKKRGRACDERDIELRLRGGGGGSLLGFMNNGWLIIRCREKKISIHNKLSVCPRWRWGHQNQAEAAARTQIRATSFLHTRCCN